MKSVLIVWVLTCGMTSFSQIEVKNTAEFKPYLEYGQTEPVPSVVFTVRVTNNTKSAVPDIDVSNRSKYLNFFVNGENSNPISMYNGVESSEEDHLIHPGESDTYQWMWLFKEEWELEKSYGLKPIVHWTYKDIKSNSIQIDLKEKAEIKPAP